MKRSNTDTCCLTLPLKLEKWQEDRLAKRFEIARQIYNTMVHAELKKLRNIENSQPYRQIQKQIRSLTDSKKMSQEEAACIRIADIRKFVESEIGQRMCAAALRQELYREQPFVIARKMSQIQEDWSGDETILVQGIIDAYFIEDGEIVLVDYKTDKVSPGGEQYLIDLYHTQLEDYAAALERMLQKKVKETYIYSFTLGKMIRL